MKYFEIGIGNNWLVRTEIELNDDYEFEVKGLVGGINYISSYFRIWIGKRVYIFDTKEGFKIKNKNKKKFKMIFGIKSGL
jgi:hypothetical protein